MTQQYKRKLIILLALLMIVFVSLACDNATVQGLTTGNTGYAAHRDSAGNYYCETGYRKSADVDTGKPWCFEKKVQP